MLGDHWVEIIAYTGEREVLVYDYWAREYKKVDHFDLQEATVPWPGKKNLI